MLTQLSGAAAAAVAMVVAMVVAMMVEAAVEAAAAPLPVQIAFHLATMWTVDI